MWLRSVNRLLSALSDWPVRRSVLDLRRGVAGVYLGSLSARVRELILERIAQIDDNDSYLQCHERAALAREDGRARPLATG